MNIYRVYYSIDGISNNIVMAAKNKESAKENMRLLPSLLKVEKIEKEGKVNEWNFETNTR